jgi:hypothetical protein
MGGTIINLTLTTGHAPKFARAPKIWSVRYHRVDLESAELLIQDTRRWPAIV